MFSEAAQSNATAWRKKGRTRLVDFVHTAARVGRYKLPRRRDALAHQRLRRGQRVVQRVHAEHTQARPGYAGGRHPGAEILICSLRCCLLRAGDQAGLHGVQGGSEGRWGQTKKAGDILGRPASRRQQHTGFVDWSPAANTPAHRGQEDDDLAVQPPQLRQLLAAGAVVVVQLIQR